MKEHIEILGNKVNCFSSYRELYDEVLKNLRSNNICHGYVTVNNVHTMIEGFHNANFQDIINQGFLSIPDGKPLEIVGKLKGNKIISRLFGPTLMENFIDWGRKDELTHFFMGSSEATLLRLKKSIEINYPGAKITGMISPPFQPINQWNHEELIQSINLVKPDIIWVGLGAPKQEQWMHSYFREIETGILFGIGAGFDYIAGNTKHAPEWMKRFALEWLYRLMQEPRRLWKRYFKTVPQFLIFASLEILGVKLKRKVKSTNQNCNKTGMNK